MKRSLLLFAVLLSAHLLFPVRSWAALGSNLVSSVVTGVSGEPCAAPCTVTIPVPASLSGNFLNVSLKWSYSGSAPAITNVYCNADTSHTTWIWTDFGKDVADPSDQSGGADYYIAGAAAGCATVSATFSQPLSTWTGHYMELRGIAPTAAIDAVAGQTSGSVSPASPGNLTTTTAGDVVYSTCVPVTNGIGTYGTSQITAASGATLLEASLAFASGSEAIVQPAAGAINPGMTFPGISGSALCMALAIKTSPGAGTAPSGPHIVQQDLVVSENATAAFQFTPLNAGDALVFVGLNSQAGSTQWTTISDTLGSLFTTYNVAASPEWAIDCDAGAGADAITIAGANAGFGNYTIQEISGLNNSSHTSCLDTKAGLAVGGGNATPYTAAPNITPSAAGELVEAMIQFGTGPATAAPSPAGAVYFNPTYTGMTDASHMTEGGGFAINISTGATQESFSWTNPNSSSWNAAALAFIPAPGTVKPTVTRHRAWVIQ